MILATTTSLLPKQPSWEAAQLKVKVSGLFRQGIKEAASAVLRPVGIDQEFLPNAQLWF